MKRLLLTISMLCSMGCVPTAHAQDRAKPKNGEGVSTFLQRFGYTSRAAQKEFLEINKGKLTRDGGLILGRSYRLPTGKKSGKKARAGSRKTSVVEPLFGPAYQNVSVRSHELEGACLYLVSGHGGPDPGAIGKVGNRELHEDEYAYDIILRLGRALMEKGAKVHIIIQDAKDGIRDDAYLSNSKRETCMGAPIPLNQVQRLQQRCDKINALYRNDRKKYKYCRAIFIHVDSRSKGKQTDVFFYHSNRRAESKKLANRMKDTFESKYGKHQPNRGFTGTVSGRNLYVLTRAIPVSVFVELGNIQNSLDQKRLVIPSNRQALANWLMEGFLKDYKGM